YLMLFSDDSYTFDPETAVSANCEDLYYLGTLDDEGDQHVYEIWMPDYDLTIDIEVTPVAKTYDVDMAVINRDLGFWSVESGKTAKAGDTVTIYAEPVAGCKVEEIYVQGGPAIKSIGNHRYTFTMPARNVLVYVTFAENINPVSVTVETGLGGTAYTNVSQAREYDTVTLTCEPQEGYRIARITGVDGLIDNGDNTYTFTMPGRAVDIQVLFLRENNPFLDINETHFFYDSVLWAAEEGITTGTDDTHFSPAGICNRAQVVTFLWRYAGSPAPTSTVNPFEDVAKGSWYEPAVLWAAEEGITSGISDTEFGPALTCNRVQVVTFLWRLMGEPETALTENPFVDVDAGSWYEPAVLWALENGITTGTDATHFTPAGECIRAQVVTFLYRTAQLPTEPTEPEPEPVVTFTLDLRDNGSGRVAYVDGKTSAAPGESIFFYALPNEGFYLDHVGIFNPDGAIDVSTIQIHEHENGLYELIMIPHDLIMTCYFYPIA
ncbi:MAG: S-layer homology domain-containing protein, partial [Oscillospiraceae bacterium]|nr:S-layer homology domain-containing protein [Oscillospiraceae bacterium]